MESDGFHASVDHMGEYHPQYFDGDKQAICIFCLKVKMVKKREKCKWDFICNHFQCGKWTVNRI